MDPVKRFSDFLQAKGLLSKDQAAAYLREGVEEKIIEFSDLFPERSWWSHFQHEDFPEGWPMLSECGFDRMVAWQIPGIVLLRGGSRPVVGVLNPFRAAEVRGLWAKHFGSVLETRLVHPRVFRRMRSEAKNPAWPEWWGDLQLGGDVPETEEEFVRVVETFCNADLLPEGSIDECYPSEVPGVHVLLRTALELWAVTHLAGDVERLRRQLLQRFSLRIHLFVGSAGTIERASVIPKAEEKRLVLDLPLSVSEWCFPIRADGMDAGHMIWKQVVDEADVRKSSDIHVESQSHNYLVRFRINGDLVVQPPLSTTEGELFIRHSKIKARGMMQKTLDEAQDGFATHIGRDLEEVDIRLAVCPTRHGEKVVIRFFRRDLPQLEALAMSWMSREAIEWFLGLRHGIFIVSGPTGSGKTTTLYACLNRLNKPHRSTLTIENPPEKMLDGASQIAIGPSVTFADAMSSVVRLDFDYLMVGEMRDELSAHTAIAAALTGHLVFSTVHANDCVGVLLRLADLGVSPNHLAYAARLILNQALVRKCCPHCSVLRETASSEMAGLPNIDLPSPVLANEPVGCLHCKHTGIIGRMGIAEILKVDETMQQLLETKTWTPGDVRRLNREKGFEPLSHQACRLAAAGEIPWEDARMLL